MKPEDFRSVKKLLARADGAKKAGSRELRFTADEIDMLIIDIARMGTLIAESSALNVHLQKLLQRAAGALQTSSDQDAGTF